MLHLLMSGVFFVFVFVWGGGLVGLFVFKFAMKGISSLFPPAVPAGAGSQPSLLFWPPSPPRPPAEPGPRPARGAGLPLQDRALH